MQGAPSDGSTVAAGVNPGSFRYGHKTYLVRKKFAKLMGASFYVEDPSGTVVMYAEQKAFKLKEDLRLYTDTNKQQELLVMKARNILDITSTFDVSDANGLKIGVLKRKGWNSMIQDEWLICDTEDREMGTVKEESLALALLRRFIDFTTYFLPQAYICTINGKTVAHYKQTKNFLLMKMNVDFTPDTDNLLDRRMGLAIAVLLCAIEGRQN